MLKTLQFGTVALALVTANVAHAQVEDGVCNQLSQTQMDESQRLQFQADVALRAKEFVQLKKEIGKVIIGQDQVVERLLITLLAEGHILFEGLPGLAKTTLIESLAQGVSGTFKQTQFVPDLLPGDIVGTRVFNQVTREYEYLPGNIFTEFYLADEINRASSKTQSALLQMMQSRKAIIVDKLFSAPRLFIVMATQNPIEQEGTYRLPEAQMDRFLMKILVDYPEFDDEIKIVQRNALGSKAEKIQAVMNTGNVVEAIDLVEKVETPIDVLSYIVRLVHATRKPEAYNVPRTVAKFLIKSPATADRAGSSPRGSIALMRAARALAFLRGRTVITIQDVKDLAKDVLAHRLNLTPEAAMSETTARKIIDEIVTVVPTEGPMPKIEE